MWQQLSVASAAGWRLPRRRAFPSRASQLLKTCLSQPCRDRSPRGTFQREPWLLQGSFLLKGSFFLPNRAWVRRGWGGMGAEEFQGVSARLPERRN